MTNFLISMFILMCAGVAFAQPTPPFPMATPTPEDSAQCTQSDSRLKPCGDFGPTIIGYLQTVLDGQLESLMMSGGGGMGMTGKCCSKHKLTVTFSLTEWKKSWVGPAEYWAYILLKVKKFSYENNSFAKPECKNKKIEVKSKERPVILAINKRGDNIFFCRDDKDQKCKDHPKGSGDLYADSCTYEYTYGQQDQQLCCSSW